jgi:two-component system chemotaxis response regulator CheB
MRILIVDGDKSSAFILQQTLIRSRYQADVVFDGEEALAKVRGEKFDVLLVDWMLPKMDGIELVRQLRKSVLPTPIIIMLTAITLPRAQEHALQAGADDYVAKPYEPRMLMQRIQDAMARRSQPPPTPTKHLTKRKPAGPPPPFVAVAIATSTGGPMALKQLLHSLPADTKDKAVFFVVLHGPDWMLTSLGDYLQSSTALHIKMACDHGRIEKGCIYIAPAGKHLVIVPGQFEMRLTDTERENFVRPSADPLFRSVAEVFGHYSIGAILTGMGRDGTQGASHIAAAKGVVLAQDPDTAVAPSMPITAIQAGLASQIPPLDELGRVIGEEILRLHHELCRVLQKK